MASAPTSQDNVYAIASTLHNSKLTPKSNSKLTLLLVNEFENQLTDWRNIFGTHFQIQTASDGLMALKAILNGNIDIVLSSTQLAQMTSADVCKFVKQHKSTEHIQMIFISDHYSEIEEEQMLDLGAIDYIASDTLPKILFSRVKNHIKLVKHTKELELVSKTDALTGIANRFCFDNQLVHDWQAVIRGAGDISLIMVDIDHFKHYNDEFGQVKGDECLTLVAQCLVATRKRTTDLVARFGGEEFVILLPFTDLVGATKIANDLVKSVNELNIPHAVNAKYHNITISAGVTSYSPTFKDETSIGIKEFMNQADVSLYKAKTYGRNQVCS
jgi:diguanylate cyclase (GGDEF)-like protein